MSNINYIHTTLGSTVTSTSTSFTESVESAALTPGTTYYIICHALIEGSSNAQVFEWQLVDRTNSDAVLTDSTLISEPNTSDVSESYHFVGKVTAGSDGGGIELQQKAASGYTVRTHYVSMLLLDLSNMNTSDYFFATDSTGIEHTDSFVSRASATLTDAKVGDQWLVLGWGAFAMDSTSKAASMALAFTEGGSTSVEPEIIFEGEDLTEQLLWTLCRPYTLAASGSVTWAVQSKDPSLHTSTPNDYIGSTVFGIKLNVFADFAQSYDTTGFTNTTSGFQEIKTETFTPSQTGNNIVIAGAVHQGANARDRSFFRVQVDGSTTPNAVPDLEVHSLLYDSADRPGNFYASVFSGTSGTGHVVDLDGSHDGSATQGWYDITLAIFSTELNYDAPVVLGRRLGSRGLFRRGSLRKNLKRLRR